MKYPFFRFPVFPFSHLHDCSNPVRCSVGVRPSGGDSRPKP